MLCYTDSSDKLVNPSVLHLEQIKDPTAEESKAKSEEDKTPEQLMTEETATFYKSEQNKSINSLPLPDGTEQSDDEGDDTLKKLLKMEDCMDQDESLN